MTHLSVQALGLQRDERLLFSSLSLTLKKGQLCRIEGPNGSGKTTLLRIISGLIFDYEGRVFWCDTPISDRRAHFNDALLYLGHRTGVKASLTPFENLQAFAGLSSIPIASSEVLIWQALAKVGLAGYTDTPVAKLSAGQQRRVALARLHLRAVPLWLLDEPFTAVDHDGVAQLEAWIAEHKARGGLVVLTSHQPLLTLIPDLHVRLDGRGGHDVHF